MHFESLFANPSGRTPRSQFIPALLTLLAVVFFYWWLVSSRSGTWSQLMLLFPAFVLHARRLRDMGITAWLLLLPLGLLLAAFAVWLEYASFGESIDRALPPVALAVAAALAVWCCIGASHAQRD